jgi:plasmid stability protein
MPDLVLKNISKSVFDALKERAAKSGKTIEEESHAILTTLAKSDREEAFARIRALKIKVRPGAKPDAVQAVRQGRSRRPPVSKSA